MPLQQTSGNVTADAYGGGIATIPNYVEDVFSTYVYSGTGAIRTISNGVDLVGKGGLVWTKRRDTAGFGNYFIDTSRGATKAVESNTTAAQITYADSLTAFTSSGYTLGADAANGGFNNGAGTYVGWTFREQIKFFDVVTYTGTGVARTITHNLGSVPGCIIVKRTDTTGGWRVYHKDLTSASFSLSLNTTGSQSSGATIWNSTAPTSSVFSVGTSTDTNANGGTYVAYLFASNAGGFGFSGNDNVITCGKLTMSSLQTATVNLGYEPQWVLLKNIDTADAWRVVDIMRGQSQTNLQILSPNSSGAETTSTGIIAPTSTGFSISGILNASENYIYIAIRRGPMKLPSDATKVFTPIARAGTGAAATVTTGFVTDAVLSGSRGGSTSEASFFDRLRGALANIITSSTGAESSAVAGTLTGFDSNTGYVLGAEATTVAAAIINRNGVNFANWAFSRAPFFFDEVCYTGTGSATTQTHNLGTTPELMIVKPRSTTGNWQVYSSTTGAGAVLLLNGTGIPTSDTVIWNNTSPTSSVFSLGNSSLTNTNGTTYVAYLFASCPGVSKIGSYTGNGSTQTINCGFTGGARFVLIKRTDSAGDWYVYDTARGMTTLTDPYLLLNSTAAESATLGSVTSVSGGFSLNASILAAINTNAASYIYLAIA